MHEITPLPFRQCVICTGEAEAVDCNPLCYHLPVLRRCLSGRSQQRSARRHYWCRRYYDGGLCFSGRDVADVCHYVRLSSVSSKTFFPKTTTCGIAIILCNLICMYTRSVPLLVTVCFFGGIFQDVGYLLNNSTIQFWLTLREIFCLLLLYLSVGAGCLQLSGLITVYTAFWIKWEYMHWLIIALLLLVMIATMILFRNAVRCQSYHLRHWLAGALMWGLWFYV